MVIKKLDVLKILDKEIYAYLDGNGPAILNPKQGVLLSRLEDLIDQWAGNASKRNGDYSENFVKKYEIIRHLKEEGFIQINDSNKIFITVRGRSYINHPRLFQIHNSYLFPYFIGFLFSLLGVLVGRIL